MLKALSSLSFLVLCFVAGISQAQTFQVPALTAPVMDEANIVDAETEAALNKVIRELRDSGGSQLNVLTIPTLNGVPIEQASIQVTDKWQLGSKKQDNGVLLLIAMQDRKMRIEVGQGLEGVLPDAIANRIIQDRIAPYMREGRTSEAVLVGVASIIENTDPQFDLRSHLAVPQAQEVPPGFNEKQLSSKFVKWLIIIMIIMFIFGGRGRRRRRGGVLPFMMGYGLGGGFRGGGGFGGGGWSGGGGGFSGGGASGGW